ncbi:AAA family ATPase [Consotaella aegiceratis]|uniref:AAA family ATPase n=1 Tax=Consotaella aegiceratis TaxID=3097961 RepID=UPI002F40DC96
MPSSSRNIHITGAAGAGVTTLGAALSQRLGLTHCDTDDFYWKRTEPPYQEKRTVEERLRRLRKAFAAARHGWVLSGSVNGWGDIFAPWFDLVVFVDTPTSIRLERLRQRELARFGAAALAPGGTMYETHTAFLDWAASYDYSDHPGRNRLRHLTWLETLACTVVKVDGCRPVDELVAEVEAGFDPPSR